jgi:hypothetical protein
MYLNIHSLFDWVALWDNLVCFNSEDNFIDFVQFHYNPNQIELSNSFKKKLGYVFNDNGKRLTKINFQADEKADITANIGDITQKKEVLESLLDVQLFCYRSLDYFLRKKGISEWNVNSFELNLFEIETFGALISPLLPKTVLICPNTNLNQDFNPTNILNFCASKECSYCSPWREAVTRIRIETPLKKWQGFTANSTDLSTLKVTKLKQKTIHPNLQKWIDEITSKESGVGKKKKNKKAIPKVSVISNPKSKSKSKIDFIEKIKDKKPQKNSSNNGEDDEVEADQDTDNEDLKDSEEDEEEDEEEDADLEFSSLKNCESEIVEWEVDEDDQDFGDESFGGYDD